MNRFMKVKRRGESKIFIRPVAATAKEEEADPVSDFLPGQAETQACWCPHLHTQGE